MKRTTSGFEFYGGVYLDSPSPAGFGNPPWNNFIFLFKEQIWTCSNRAIVNAAETYESLLHLPHASAKDPHGHVCFVLLPSHGHLGDRGTFSLFNDIASDMVVSV